MCDSAGAGSRTSEPRPCFLGLYAGFAVVGAALVAVTALAPAGPVAALLDLGLVVVAGAAAALWVRANRVALDLAASCNCAGPTTIRVFVSPPLDEGAVASATAVPHRGAERIDVEEATPVEA